jgi:hypothetical protein
VERVLRALGKGEAAKVSSLLTAGALRDFGSGPLSEVAPIRSLQFLAAHDVAARNIDRHGDKVARIVYYRLGLDKGRRYVLVHLTRDGTVTDFDLVDD